MADDAMRWDWLKETLNVKSQRAVARCFNTSHQRVARWVQNGDIPPDVLLLLVVEHGADPMRAAVVWGMLRDEDVPRLNYEAMVRYAPIEVLADEHSRRTRAYRKTRPDTLRKTSALE